MQQPELPEHKTISELLSKLDECPYRNRNLYAFMQGFEKQFTWNILRKEECVSVALVFDFQKREYRSVTFTDKANEMRISHMTYLAKMGIMFTKWLKRDGELELPMGEEKRWYHV